ncbi:MAG: hypothetical protein NTX45_29280 [Proteobacteria bacterium]|nr:hypothetical protein [Pseudomonadota bacterium]
MIGMILRSVSWKTFAAGAATVVVGETIARPLLVSVFKAGIGVKSAVVGAYAAAAGAYEKAREEAGSIYADAAKVREGKDPFSGLVAEIRQLREDVSALKTQSPDLKAKP